MEMNLIVVLACLSAMVQYTQQAAVISPPDGYLHVYGLPVGQGDGTIIQCPNGDISIVDLGSTTRTQTEGDYMTDPELAAFLGTYVQRLKYIFISHADQDHFNLFPKLNVPTRTVNAAYLGCSKNDYPTSIMSWITSAANTVVADLKINTVVSICGSTGPQINIRVLASNTDVYNIKVCSNEDSLVLRLEYGTFTLLLPGDLEDYSGFTYDQDGYITSRISGAYGKPGVLRTVINNWANRSGGIASAVYRFAHHGTWPNGNKPFSSFMLFNHNTHSPAASFPARREHSTIQTANCMITWLHIGQGKLYSTSNNYERIQSANRLLLRDKWRSIQEG